MTTIQISFVLGCDGGGGWLAKLGLVCELFNMLELRIVNVRLTLITPNGDIAETQHHGMLRLLVVHEHVAFDVSGAKGLVASQTDPVLASVLALGAWLASVHSRLAGHGLDVTEMGTCGQGYDNDWARVEAVCLFRFPILIACCHVLRNLFSA